MRQVVAGIVKCKQDTYKRINASKVQYNVEQAKVRVSVVFAVV